MTKILRYNIYSMGVLAVSALMLQPVRAENNIKHVVPSTSQVLKIDLPELPDTINSITNGEISFDCYLGKVGRQNLQFLADRLNVNIAEAEVVAAKVLPDPSVDFEASKDSYTLGLSYTLELGKRYARVKLARSESEMEKLALTGAFQDLRAQAAELFLDAILQKELMNVKQTSYEYMNEFSKSDSLRFKMGEITENDARQSHLEAVSLLNDVYEQEAAYHSALVELNRFMGIDSDSLFIPSGNWEEMERNFTLPELILSGINNRVDITSAAQNVEVNKRAYKLERAERRPDIDLSISYEREWNYFLPQARYATVGVSVPLSFSALNRGALKSAKFKIEQAEYMQKDVQLQVKSEIRQAWYAFESERKKVEQYKTGVLDDALKVLEGMVFSYQRGESSVLDVLISQRSYNEVCQDYLETMKGYVSSLVELEKACGIWDIHF